MNSRGLLIPKKLLFSLAGHIFRSSALTRVDKKLQRDSVYLSARKISILSTHERLLRTPGTYLAYGLYAF